MVSVSVIIPTYNKAKHLNLTLASFMNQTFDDYELIIIDDGSTDNTRSISEKYSKKMHIKYIFQNNKGRAYARNIGIELAEGKYIIFNDDDRIVHPDFVSRHYNELEIGDEKSIIIGWKHNILSFYDPDIEFNEREYNILTEKFSGLEEIIRQKKSIQLIDEQQIVPYCENKLKKFIVTDGFDNFLGIIDHFGDDLEGFHFKWILGTTANMSMHKSFAIKINSFDINYTGWGMEDTDFSYRLSKNGAKFSISRGAYNLHQYHQRTNLLDSLKRNIIYFCEKYNDLDSYLYYRCYSLKKIKIIEANEIFSKAIERKEIYKELTELYSESFQIRKNV